ncbi:MAG: GTPase Era [Gammaproteobacteria bacterium]
MVNEIKVTPITHCGTIALVGAPNVGKSTLLNRLIGQKISITSRKAQTTRHSIIGVNTVKDCQIIYVDTPGIHCWQKRAMNRVMDRTASAAMRGVDGLVFMVNGLFWGEDDDLVLTRLQNFKGPIILAINKVDLIPDKKKLLPYLQQLQAKMNVANLIPISAKQGDNIDKLEQAMMAALPPGTHLFAADQVTDRSSRFIASELIREKIFRLTGQELPYASTVEIEQFKLHNKVYHIDALIWIERPSQKSMIIGKGGARLKQIGTQARIDLEKMLEQKVFLKLWVKVKSGWSNDDHSLREFGYG